MKQFTLLALGLTAGIALAVAGTSFARGNGEFPTAQRLDQMATLLGIPKEELSAQLGPKKTLQQLAEENGISPEGLQEKMRQAHTQQMTQRLQNMVEAGTITQEQADLQIQWHADHEQWLKDHPMPLSGMMKSKHLFGGFNGGGRMRHMRSAPVTP